MVNYELKFEISIYDNDNDLIERYIVYTEEEKEDILKKHYHKDNEAKYCNVMKIQTETNYFSKSR